MFYFHRATNKFLLILINLILLLRKKLYHWYGGILKRPLYTVCAIVAMLAVYRYAAKHSAFAAPLSPSQQASNEAPRRFHSTSTGIEVKGMGSAHTLGKQQEVAALSTPSRQIPGETSRRVNPYPIPKRIDFGHIEGKGIGYDRGYTQMSIVLGPEYRIGHGIALLDLRGVIFDDGKLAANIGMIGRFLPKFFCEVFGVNIFYDFREGKLGNFNQISGGFEMLHRRWELHMSARAPVGVTKHIKKCVFDDYIGPFREVCKTRQIALNAFDLDVGYYFVKAKDFQFYVAAGPYYLSGASNSSALGGRAVLRPQFTDYFAVEFSVSHDRIYETIYQLNAIFSLPLYKFSPVLNKKRGPCRTTNRQIYQPIGRDVILRKKKHCHNNF
jgi:hypothetical protein